VRAAELAIDGQSGVMVAVRGDEIISVDLQEACSTPRPLDATFLDTAAWFLA
jgi:hypothetical protein